MEPSTSNPRTGRLVFVALVAGVLAVVAFAVVSCVRGAQQCPPGQVYVRVHIPRSQGSGEAWVCRSVQRQ